MSQIIVAKNISQLKNIVSQYQVISITGFNIPILMHSHAIHHSKDNNVALIDVRKIREYCSIFSSVHYSIIGLSNSISRLLSISTQQVLSPLLQKCFTESYYYDEWTHTLFQAIFGTDSSPLLKLFLVLSNAQIQIIKDNTLQWVTLRKLINIDGSINIEYYIPIRIKIDLHSKTHHVLLSPSNKNFTSIPSFSQPIVMGQLFLDTYSPIINNAWLLYYHHNHLITFDDVLSKLIGDTIPIPQSEIIKIWDRLRQTEIKNIERTHLDFLIQSLIRLLSPNLI